MPAWPPSAAFVAVNGGRLVALFGAPVALFLLWDALFKARRVNFEELEWKRREVQRASIKLQEVVKGERTKYYLEKLGAGGEGVVRLTFTLNVGGYSELQLREELERLASRRNSHHNLSTRDTLTDSLWLQFEVTSDRLLLVEDTLEEGEREGSGSIDAAEPDDGTKLVRSNSVQLLVAKLTEQLKDQLTEKGAKISQAFQMVDRNGDGSISSEQFALGLADVGVDMTSDDVSQLVASIDGDADGRISLHEWTVAFGPRQVTVAILPEEKPEPETKKKTDESDGDGSKAEEEEEDANTKKKKKDDDGDDPDVIARQLKKKLNKLGKSTDAKTGKEKGKGKDDGKEEAAAKKKAEEEDADRVAYPLLSAVETQVSPVQTEVNELKWTEAKRIYKWRREASHKRFRDQEIDQNAAELCKKDAALGKPANLADKIVSLRRERDDVDALLLQASHLTWQSLQREVSECVTKMTDSDHAEHEKFRDGKAIKDVLRLLRRERKRIVRATYGKGLRAIAVRQLDYFGLIDRNKWCPALAAGPSRGELVAAVNAIWAKKKEQYSKLGVLLQLASTNAPDIMLGTFFNTLSGGITPLTLKFKSDMIRALEQNDPLKTGQSFRSLIYIQFITMFIDNLSNRFTRKGADAVSQTLKRKVGKAIISQDMRYFDSVSSTICSTHLRKARSRPHFQFQPSCLVSDGLRGCACATV